MNSHEALKIVRKWYRAPDRTGKNQEAQRLSELREALEALTDKDWRRLTDDQRLFVASFVLIE